MMAYERHDDSVGVSSPLTVFRSGRRAIDAALRRALVCDIDERSCRPSLPRLILDSQPGQLRGMPCLPLCSGVADASAG